MKIVLTENQIKILTEQNISYTPDKLKEFEQNGKSFLDKATDSLHKFKNQIIMSSISDYISDEEKYRLLKEYITKFEQKSEDISNKLYDIVEIDSDDDSDILRNIYNLANKIQDVYYKFGELNEVMEKFIEFAETFKD